MVAGFEEDVEAEVEGFEGDAEGFGSVLGFSSFFFFAGEGVASSVDDRGQLAARKWEVDRTHLHHRRLWLDFSI